jgi:hypothetical protein
MPAPPRGNLDVIRIPANLDEAGWAKAEQLIKERAESENSFPSS